MLLHLFAPFHGIFSVYTVSIEERCVLFMTIIAKGRAKGFGSFPGYIKDEIQAIAEAFSYYEFDDQEKGLYYLCKRIFKTRYSKRLASVIRGQKSELYVQQHYGVDRIYPRYHKRNGDSGCHKIFKRLLPGRKTH